MSSHLLCGAEKVRSVQREREGRENSQKAIASAYIYFWMKFWQGRFQAPCWNALQLLHQFRIYDISRLGKLGLDRWALHPRVTGHAPLVAAGSWIQMMRNAVFIPRPEVQKHVSDINQINGGKWYSEDWLKNVLSCILCSTSKLSLKSQNLREMSTWTPLLWLCYKSAFTEQGLTLGHWIVSWVLKFVMVSCSE